MRGREVVSGTRNRSAFGTVSWSAWHCLRSGPTVNHRTAVTIGEKTPELPRGSARYDLAENCLSFA